MNVQLIPVSTCKGIANDALHERIPRKGHVCAVPDNEKPHFAGWLLPSVPQTHQRNRVAFRWISLSKKYMPPNRGYNHRS